MGGTANSITLVEDWTQDESLLNRQQGVIPKWKKYSFMFGDSYSTGGESIATMFADFTMVLSATVEPTVVHSADGTTVGPYLLGIDLTNQKLLLYNVSAEGVIAELGNNTDVWSDASQNLVVTVSIYGY